jgi:RNA polymerase sigma factor (sigma-70 family)
VADPTFVRQLIPVTEPPAAKPTWEDIARSHGRFIYSVAYRLTGSHDDSQDLVQEVLLRVRRGLDTYEPGSMEGWLSRITSNAFLDDVRKRRRRPVHLVGAYTDQQVAVDAEPDAVLARAALPDEIQAALMRVPEDFRVAVVLADVVGLDYAEIARQLDVPLGTVRSRIHRGRLLLRGFVTPAEGAT